jgi:WD40 repeat protein/tRNA A-37 threonylcarbamoyl transferase component Bud32
LTPYQVNQLLQSKGDKLVLGPYVILERLGEGGMGQVYKARHRLMDRVVALKVIRQDRLADSAAAGRFLREIKAAAQLSHPNIVTAYDATQVGDTLVFAMEFVDGPDLARLVKQGGALPVEQACEYVRQAAAGLAHAHDRGLVHRDIKPSNLLVSFREGTVKVLDMGLARLRQSLREDDQTGGLTQPETVMGTPDYIAPEQALNAHNVDIRADLYSLGGSLYYLLTGQVPFPGGSSTEKLLKRQLEDPVSLERLRPEVPAGLSAVVRKMMARRPEDRYQTPDDVARELAPFIGVKPAGAEPGPAAILPQAQIVPKRKTGIPSPSAQITEAVPVPAPHLSNIWARPVLRWLEEAVQQLRQRPRWTAGIAAAVLLVIAAWWLIRAGRHPLDRLDRDDIPPAERFAWQPEDVVAVLGEHCQRHWKSVTMVAVSPDGKLLASCAGDDPFVYLWDALTRQERGLLRGHAERVLCLAFAPDGRRLASGSMDNTVKLWDLATRNEITTLHGHKDDVLSLAFAPGGKLLASGSGDRTVQLWDLSTATSQATLDGHKGTVSALAFTPNGTLAAGVSGNPCMVQLWDTNTRTAAGQLAGQPGEGRILSAAITPDGKTLAVTHSSDVIQLYDLSRQTQTAVIPRHGAGGLAISPDGQILAAGGRIGAHPETRGDIRLWDVATASERGGLQGETKHVSSVAFVPEGKTLAAGTTDGSLQLWDMAGRQERPPLQGPAYAARCVAFSPDGTLLAWGSDDGSLRLWDLARGKNRLPFKVHRDGVLCVAFSPDGRLLASGGRDDSVRLWDVASAQVRDTLHGFGRGVQALAFSADGQLLLIGDGYKTELREVARAGAKPKFQLAEGVPALAPDGKTIALGRGAELKLYETAAGKERLALLGAHYVTALAFPRDSGLVAAGNYHRDSGSYAVKLWSASSEKELRTLTGPKAEVRQLAFSANGRMLAACGVGGQVLLWDPQNGKLQHEWELRGAIHGVAIAPDGRYLATANASGTVYILRLPKELQQAGR